MKRVLVVSGLALILGISACTPAPGPNTSGTTVPAVPSTPIMGAPQYSDIQLTAWYRSKGKTQPAGSCATVAELAKLFIIEGFREGVRGDIAFIQAMLETGWLQHSERVPAAFCNYSGIGAVDGGTGANQFVNATIGVRAQIQHLRAYADRNATCENFKLPTVDPRCKYVNKGKVTIWEKMGNGNWATDPEYGPKILGLLANLKAFTTS